MPEMGVADDPTGRRNEDRGIGRQRRLMRLLMHGMIGHGSNRSLSVIVRLFNIGILEELLQRRVVWGKAAEDGERIFLVVESPQASLHLEQRLPGIRWKPRELRAEWRPLQAAFDFHDPTFSAGAAAEMDVDQLPSTDHSR